MRTLELDTGPNGLPTWKAIYEAPAKLSLSARAQAALARSHMTVAGIVEGVDAVYGINTGFGKMADTLIPQDALATLQSNLVLSHTVGSGAPLSLPETRLVMALKIASLAQGYSGVRPELVDLMIAMVNHDVLPVIPCQGSVGASGDLAPQAHLAAPLIGAGFVHAFGQVMAAEEAFARAGLTPLTLHPKEGLSLLNGTQVSTALALTGTFEARQALDTAVIIGALTSEAVLGSVQPFEDRLHRVRRHPGQIEIARRLRALTAGSEFRGVALTDGRRQDPYCIRCQPQILGACLELLDSVDVTLEREADAVTDNPIVFSDTGDILTGGNFHAEPVAFAADQTALAICEIGALSERRLAMMVDTGLSGLPAFLTSDAGLSSGFMSGQIAAAAMVAENRQKAHPASVDSIPTVANQEDHVSMATHGARRLTGMVETLNNILAIELLASVEGTDHVGLALSPRLAAVKDRVRARVPRMNKDRWFAPDYDAARHMVKSGEIAEA